MAAAAVLPLCDCSFLFLDRPPDRVAPYEKLNCTTSYALPTVDTVLSLLHIVSIGIVQSSSGNAFGGSKSRDAISQIDLSWLILEGGSAIWGYYKVNQCNEMMAAAPYRPHRTTGPREPRIEPTPPWRAPPPEQEPSAEPPAPGQEQGIEPPKPPPPPRVRQQMDGE